MQPHMKRAAHEQPAIDRRAVWGAQLPVRAGIVELLSLAVVLALIVVVATWVSQPLLRVQVAANETPRYLGGLGALEQSDYGIYRWSGTRVVFRVFGMEQRAPLSIRARLSARREAGQPPALLTVTGGRQLPPVTLGPEWRRYALLLPSPPRGDEVGVVTLQSSTVTFEGDSRQLGFALDWIEARQHPRAFAERLPDAGRLVFLVALALLVYALLRRRCAAPVALSGALGLALALGAGIVRAPAQIAYWLPNLWLVPILGWLALALPPLVRGLRRRYGGQGPARAAGAALAVGAAQLLLPLQHPWANVAGWSLLLGGCAALVAWVEPTTDDRPPTADHPSSILYPLSSVPLALLGCTLLALALRLFDLGRLPLGLWRDEARHGLLALRILHDPAFRPVYVPAVADIPALLFYLAAAPIAMFGPHAWTVRLVPAVVGALTPLAVYFAARPLFGARVGLAAAGLLAVSAWHIALSRLAFAATLGPPLTLLAVGLLWRALEPGLPRRRLLQAGLAGSATGLALYAYHPSRLTPLVVALAAVLILGRDRSAWRAAAPRLALLVATAALVALPLLRYALADPEGYYRRVGRTSILSEASLEGRAPAAPIEGSARATLGMWHARGDGNGRHNLPGAPMLDPVSGALFATGTALALARARDRRSALLLGWLGVMLLPGIFSGQAPHAVRTVEAIIPTMILGGIGAVALIDLLGNRARLINRDRRVLGIGAGVVAAALALNIWRYFVAWPATPQAYGEFYVADTRIGAAARQLAGAPEIAANDYRIYVPAVPRDRDVLNYLTQGLDIGSFEGPRLSVPPGDRALLLAYGDTPEADREAARRALGADAALLGVGPAGPAGGPPEFIVYGRGPEAPQVVARVLGAWR